MNLLPVGPLDDPPVVDVLGVVTRDLLLVRRSSLVRVLDWVLGVVTVQPARCSVRVPERHLRTVHHLERLAP